MLIEIIALVTFINSVLIVIIFRDFATERSMITLRRITSDIWKSNLAKVNRDELFERDFFDDSNIFKYTATRFERVIGMPPFNHGARIKICYTSPENAKEHKEEITSFKKEADKFKNIEVQE